MNMGIYTGDALALLGYMDSDGKNGYMIQIRNVDNVVKAILDGLNGVAYHDDSQVVYVDAEKFYADEPCVIVEVSHYE
jgi:Holliday junction resolvase RusA-like endonuclease